MWWWRTVRNHNYWIPDGQMPSEGLGYYAHDVMLRERELGLSVFSVSDLSHVERVTHYFALTRSSPDNIDYLLIPDGVWTTLGLRPEPSTDDRLHPFLSNLHHEVFGCTKQMSERLALLIVEDPNRQAGRTRKSAIEKAGKTYLQTEIELENYLNEGWKAKLLKR
jgi:hypothetical protein